MTVEVLWGLKAAEPSRVDVGDADASGFAQRFQAGHLFGFPVLDQPKSIAQYLAGILVTSGGNEFFDQVCLMDCQDDIASWHGRSPMGQYHDWHSMP